MIPRQTGPSPPGQRPGRRLTPSVLTASVFAVLVALAVAAFWVIHTGVDRQDQELLREQTSQAALLLQRNVERTSSLLGSVGVGPKVFDANANALRARPATTVALVSKGRADAAGNVTPGRPRITLAVGHALHPGQLLTGELAHIALTARPTLSGSPVINVAGSPSVVFSIVPPAIGLPGYVALEVMPISPGQPAPTIGPYPKLDLALYATPTPRPAELIASTIGQSALPQPTASAELRVGSLAWAAVGAAKAPLLASTAQATPWIVLGWGLVLALGMAITVETLIRRQREQRGVAGTLQAALLGPVDQELPHGVSARYQPAVRPLEVGGDWYDVVKLRDGRLGLMVGDCVGRGVEAAAVMGQLRSVSHSLMLQGKTPREVLSDLDTFAQRIPAARCTTVFCGLVDPSSKTVRYSSAGHPPAILMRRDGISELLDQASSVPLAIAGVERTEASAALCPGCTLALYTDGLVERRSQSLDDGLAGLEHVIADNRHLEVQSLASAIMDAMHAADSEDDVALLVYRVPLVEPPLLAVRMPADPARLSDLRRELRAWLESAGYAEDAEGVLVSVGEACSNAIEHAYEFDPRAAVDIRAEIEGGRLEVTVGDSGRWRRPDPSGTQRGRGLTLIQAFMDDYKIETGTGTTVHLSKHLTHDR